jgi:uncharacterized protein (DUF305 family)
MTKMATLTQVLSVAAILILVATVCAVLARPTHAATARCTDRASGAAEGECQFFAENKKIMDKMMEGMEITPAGTVDADFAKMMIPHHQGAIDMAVLELRHGRNEQLRRIAQEIIVDQQQEIDAIRLAVGQR